MSSGICSAGRHPLASLCVASLLLSTGCVSNKYADAKKDTPPAQPLNVRFAPAPLDAALNSVITCNGPGSWKRDALWDEFVVTFRNAGDKPLTVASATLVDLIGTGLPPGNEPWSLEKASQAREKKYRQDGVAFARETSMDKVKVGTGVGIVAAGIGATGLAATAGAAVFWGPIYLLASSSRNHEHKQAIEAEFVRRCLVLPVTLAPGETRRGSLFFAAAAGPRAIALHWSMDQQAGDATLPLDFLHELHLAARTPAAAGK